MASMGSHTAIYLVSVGSFIVVCAFLSLLPKTRSDLLKAQNERVVVLGGSSGIGKAIALLYASRGARVWLVARREVELALVKEECEERMATRLKQERAENPFGAKPIQSIKEDLVGRVRTTKADVCSIDDLVQLRAAVESDWDGFDTLVLTAGMSSLQPLLTMAGVDPRAKEDIPDTSPEGIEQLRDVVKTLSDANYLSGVLVAATFVPILQRQSLNPAILLISSAAALIPAPTRSLYCSTKAAALSFFQSLSIEHPRIAFTFVIPGTVNTAFRTSARDQVGIKDTESQTEKKLEPEDVARRAVHGVDSGQKMVWMPQVYGVAHVLYYVGLGRFIEQQARKKYGFV